MDTKILTLFGDEDFQSENDSAKNKSLQQPDKQKTGDKKINNDIRSKVSEEQKIDEDVDSETPKLHATTKSTGITFEAPIAAPQQKDFVVGKSHNTIQSTTPDQDVTEEANLNADENVSAQDHPSPDSNPIIEQDTNDEDNTNTIDATMRTALVQTDYAAYFLQPKTETVTQKSNLVFEGIVTKKDRTVSVPDTVAADNNTIANDDIDESEEPAEPLPDFNLESRYYTIGEVAKLFNVNNSHIRFWTNEFKLKPRTTRKGDRLYNTEDIATLRLIHHLVKVKRHTIKGAKERLKQKDTVAVNLDLGESLLQLKELLVQIKNRL
jgi:DNA-binding transcriptional MerR regulator